MPAPHHECLVWYQVTNAELLERSSSREGDGDKVKVHVSKITATISQYLTYKASKWLRSAPGRKDIRQFCNMLEGPGGARRAINAFFAQMKLEVSKESRQTGSTHKTVRIHPSYLQRVREAYEKDEASKGPFQDNLVGYFAFLKTLVAAMKDELLETYRSKVEGKTKLQFLNLLFCSVVSREKLLGKDTLYPNSLSILSKDREMSGVLNN